MMQANGPPSPSKAKRSRAEMEADGAVSAREAAAQVQDGIAIPHLSRAPTFSHPL
jgi:hypothetical protein